jgi:capsular polysaccharide transport system ATP-binding protein
LGRNGSGKSTLIRIISGAESPSSGSVVRSMSVSWPLAFGGAFQSSLTGFDNLRFICRVYNVSVDNKIQYVQEFSELGKYLYEPLRTYSAGMRARLAFAISMAVEFDCFLIDEVFAVGDARFQEKCKSELFEKRNDRSLIIVSHDANFIKEHCDRASVLISGVLHSFDMIEEAYDFYMEHAF